NQQDRNYLIALALSILPQQDEKVEKLMKENIKFDPKSVESYVLLGLNYWKKRDYKQSKECFENALTNSNRKHIKALQYLSFVMRCIGEGQERSQNVENSIKIAKEALMLDMKNGESWYILGNATFTEQYQSQEYKNPDLYYNRGNIYKYIQDYNLAIEQYEKAYELDNTLDRFNKNMILTAKITHVITQNEEVPAQFVAVDLKGEFFCFSVYNTSKQIYDQVKRHSEIFCIDPIVKSMSLNKGDKENQGYKNVQVFDIKKFMVDYNKITDTYSPCVLNNQTI
ncbi:tetratricopeptide repeat protein, partial [Ichthyophthirius multifiliis]